MRGIKQGNSRLVGLYKYSLALLLIISVVIVPHIVRSSTVQAAHCPSPFSSLSPDPGAIPDYVDHNLKCANSYPQTPALDAWVADASDASKQQITVNAGDRTVSLGFRAIATVGWRHDSPPPGVPPQSGWIISQHTRLEDATATRTSSSMAEAYIRGVSYGPSGTEITLTGFNNTPRFTAQGMVGFTLETDDPGGFKPGTYSIAFSFKRYNRFSPGHSSCVNNAGVEIIMASPSYDRCRTEATQPMTIEITVGPGYNHEAILRVTSHAVAPGRSACYIVRPGTTISFGFGMRNVGTSRGGITSVEFKNPDPSHVTNTTGAPPAVGDPYSPGGGYDSNSMSSGEGAVPHYYRSRSQTPRTGELYWEVIYQPVGYRISGSAPNGLDLEFRSAVTRATPGQATDFSDIYRFVVHRTTPVGPNAGCIIEDDPGPADCAVPNSHISGFPQVTVSLPDQSPNDPPPSGTAVGPPGGSTTYNQRVRQGRTNVTATNDVSSGGSRFTPPLIRQSYQSATINYQQFVDNYPFDRNQGSVTYDSYYNNYTWTGTSTWRWQHIYSYCSSPRYDRRGRYTGCRRWTHVYGWVLTSNSWTRGRRGPNQTVRNTVLAAPMNPCWFRRYDSEPESVSAQLSPDRENPNQASFSGQVRVTFNVTRPSRGLDPMRQPSRVRNLTYVLESYVEDWRGTRRPRPTQHRTIPEVLGSTFKSSTGSHSVSDSISVSVPGTLQVGDKICWRITLTSLAGLSRERGEMDVDGNIQSGSGRQATEFRCTPAVVNWPYFKVFGGDVASGGSFGSPSCTGGGGITAYNRNASAGSSTQYAAFALGSISGFTSVGLRSGAGSPAAAPLGLTFANTTGGFGGSFSGNGGMLCLPDFFGGKPATTPVTPGSVPGILSTQNPDARRVEYYEVNQSMSLPAVNVPNGVRKAIYVNGTLTINGNMTINDTWTDRGDMSYVIFIARDVVINGGVSRIDGVYVAQSGGGGTGTIRTCHALAGFFACNGPLVINGGFIAEHVDFLRTRGSLRDAKTNEGLIGTAQPFCSHGLPSAVGVPGLLPGNTCAAEVFSFGPDIFLTLSGILAPENNFKLDSYVTLPPNL